MTSPRTLVTVILIVTAGGNLVEATPAPPAPATATARESPLGGSFLALGQGLTREAGVDGVVTALQLGQALTQKVQLIEDITVVSPDDRATLALGIRWCLLCSGEITMLAPSPMPYRFFVRSSLYVKAKLGVSLRDQPVDQPASGRSATSVGPMAAASLGWLPMQGLDYAIGLELTGSAARHDASNVYGLDLMFVVQVRN